MMAERKVARQVYVRKAGGTEFQILVPATLKQNKILLRNLSSRPKPETITSGLKVKTKTMVRERARPIVFKKSLLVYVYSEGLYS